MDQISKEAIAESVQRRLSLSGFSSEEQTAAWQQALYAILDKEEREATSRQPQKEQSNYRQMLGLARQAFGIEIRAYQKYLSDLGKGATPEEAGVSLRSRLENQQVPVVFA